MSLAASLDVELMRREGARVALEIADHPLGERLSSVLAPA
jgi:hypothetical protein